jgi:hypothetical protein
MTVTIGLTRTGFGVLGQQERRKPLRRALQTSSTLVHAHAFLFGGDAAGAAASEDDEFDAYEGFNISFGGALI